MSLQSKESTWVMQNLLLNTRFSKAIDNHLSIHGLSFTEYMIMDQLSAATSKTMRRIELAESVGITASGVTRLLAPMEKTGIIEKEVNPRDARVSLVKLTKTGQKLYKDASVTYAECSSSLLSVLSANQISRLSELTMKLL